MRKYFLIIFLSVASQLTVSSQKLNRDSLRIDSLKKVLPSLHDIERINGLNSLAEAYLGYNGPGLKLRADSAGFYAMQANNEAIRIGNKYGLAKSLLNLSGVQKLRTIVKMRSGITDSMGLKTWEQFLSQAIVLGEELNNDEILAKVNGLKASLFMMKKDIPAQIESYKRSIYYSQKAGDEKAEGEICLWLSMIYSQRGDYEESFEYGQKALRLNKKSVSKITDDVYRNYLVQESLNSLSILYREAGDLETAMSYLRENHLFGIANNTGWTMEEELGELFNTLGQYDSSFYYLLKFTKEVPKNLWGKINLGKTYFSTKQSDKAIKLFQEVIDSARRRNTPGYLGNALIGVSKVYMLNKNYKKALSYAKEGSGLLEHNQPDVMNNAELLSDIYRHLGKNDSAYLYLKKYITIKDSILNRQFLLRLNNFKSQVEYEKKEGQIALLNKDNKIKDQQLKQEAILKYFLLLGLLALLLIGIFIFRNLILKRKNAKFQVERLEHEMKMQQLASEKKQAELHQKAVELEMQALRAQMNPHFIFNCLNSINRFIFKNETREASDYLTRFSRLIRMVLLHSQKKLVPLEDELEMLRLYLDMERLRFKNAFDYHITTTNAIENSSVFIPPLLLQPFCENAIWHGLMHKEGPGHLNIELNEDNGILNCIITDDGVGREKAEEFKSKSAEKEKSMGLKITKERLSLLNQGTTGGTFYEIEDVKNEQGDIAGTRVQLKIKYKETVEETV